MHYGKWKTLSYAIRKFPLGFFVQTPCFCPVGIGGQKAATPDMKGRSISMHEHKHGDP